MTPDGKIELQYTKMGKKFKIQSAYKGYYFFHFAGQRLKEGGHINRSLLTLGSVIAKLSEGER